MAWYKTGSLNLTNGNATVYGNGTLWVDAAVLNPGDVLVAPDGKLYEIGSFQSNTQLTLTTAYLGPTAATQSYSIMPIGLLPSALAQQVKTTLSTANTALSQAVRFDAQQNLTAAQQATARANIGALAGADVGLGLLSKSVAGGVDVVLTGVEAGALFYEFTGALTANINVVVPTSVRQFYARNNTSGAYTLTVKTANGTGITVLQGTREVLECDGTNVLRPTAITGALSVNSSGNVGIGTNVPSARLDVNSGATSLNTLLESTATTTELAMSASGTTTSPRIGATGNDIIFKTNGTEALRVNSAGSVGIGTTGPSQKLTVVGGAMITGPATLGVSSSAGLMSMESSVMRNYVGDGTGWSWAFSKRAASATTDLVTFKDSGDVLINGGNLLVGVTSAGQHRIAKNATVDAGNNILDVWSSGASAVVALYSVSAAGFAAANTAMKIAKDGVTGRSVNAGGTINASGADYAEYMTKAASCGEIAKGQIVGVNAGGLLTDKWSDAVSFLIKSTDPSYVGGDTWGSEEVLGAQRPIEPVFEGPIYAGPAAPQEPPAVAEPTLPPVNPGDAADDAAKAAYEQAQADYALLEAEYAQYQVDLAAYESAAAVYANERAVHDAEVAVARHQFDTETMPAYQVQLAAFEAKLEFARQRVDRIAYCGQVPVNVTGATPGQYVVPIQDGDDIAGQLVDEDAITFAQYRRAVGVVQNVLADGRANVRVKVV